MFKRLLGEILFFSFPRDDVERVKSQIMAENAKYVRIWSIIQGLYWIFCLYMSMSDAAYMRCRDIYAVALVVCVATLALSTLVAPKHTWLVFPLSLAVDLTLLGSGVFIARLLAPQTIVIFASVLIVPVVFINSSMSTIALLLANIALFSVVGTYGMNPAAYTWTLSNLIIFSSVGVMLGHFINKARYERYVFAETAVQLAELQTKYAYYDQMTGLLNRRAYAERFDELAKGMPSDCCVIMADINGLKDANDTLGHEAGDELIVGAAQCLTRCFEVAGSIYRIGGDEFCVIATGTEDYLKDCLKRLEESSGKWKGSLVNGISISYGLAFGKEFHDIDSTMKAADLRMYAFKSNYYLTSGKDRRHRSTQWRPPTTS